MLYFILCVKTNFPLKLSGAPMWETQATTSFYLKRWNYNKKQSRKKTLFKSWALFQCKLLHWDYIEVRPCVLFGSIFLWNVFLLNFQTWHNWVKTRGLIYYWWSKWRCLFFLMWSVASCIWTYVSYVQYCLTVCQKMTKTGRIEHISYSDLLVSSDIIAVIHPRVFCLEWKSSQCHTLWPNQQSVGDTDITICSNLEMQIHWTCVYTIESLK